MPLAVALADDNLIVRAGVTQILATETDMAVVASCGDLRSLVEAIERERPDVVVSWLQHDYGQLGRPAESLAHALLDEPAEVIRARELPPFRLRRYRRGPRGRRCRWSRPRAD